VLHRLLLPRHPLLHLHLPWRGSRAEAGDGGGSSVDLHGRALADLALETVPPVSPRVCGLLHWPRHDRVIPSVSSASSGAQPSGNFAYDRPDPPVSGGFAGDHSRARAARWMAGGYRIPLLVQYPPQCMCFSAFFFFLQIYSA
jgi:hypothetical protein